jgi:hypothetical protein
MVHGPRDGGSIVVIRARFLDFRVSKRYTGCLFGVGRDGIERQMAHFVQGIVETATKS